MSVLSIWPDFISFRWLDAIDVFLVAILLYQLYKLVKGTVAINIFAGILSVYFFWIIVKALNMQLLSTILGQFISVGVIALMIVFQQELRRFLLMIGTTGIFGRIKFGSSFFSGSDFQKKSDLDIPTLIKACKNMAESKTGAIIVFQTKSDLSFYANTGDAINAMISLRLLESIFYKNSPLHDGAVIVSGNNIVAARCVLPVSENPDFPAHLGMRHRAAVGITENSDALALIVSEQTGEIAYAFSGELKTNISLEELKSVLEKQLLLK